MDFSDQGALPDDNDLSAALTKLDATDVVGILRDFAQRRSKQQALSIISRMPDSTRELIIQCLEPKHRPTIENIRQQEQRREAMVLDKIFKSRDFIEKALAYGAKPALVGRHLDRLYNSQQHGGTVYLCLISLDWEGDLAHSRGERVEWLRGCLQDHDYDSETCEARMKGSNIVLNIWEWARSDDATAITNFRDVIAEKVGDTYRTYMMYTGDYSGVWECQLQLQNTSCDVFRLICDRYLYRGKPVKWAFFEWTGKASVGGG
jgi:hypothetical protein